MHKEQCIGPGRWASPWWFPVCFSGSVYQQIHYCKQLVMGESGGERGGEKRGKGRVLGSKPEWVAPSCGRTVFLSLSAMLSGSLQSKSNKFLRKREREREKKRSGLDAEVMQVWLHWHKVRWPQRGVFLFLVLVFFFLRVRSAMRSLDQVVFSLQSPFQHTTDPEMTTLKDFTMSFFLLFFSF